VRFLFYELIARSVISKEGDRPDKIVSEALTDLRERRLVPWDDIGTIGFAHYAKIGLTCKQISEFNYS
jgi:hypothetical protein